MWVVNDKGFINFAALGTSRTSASLPRETDETFIINTLAGYIIGLPHDTETSVRSDIERLISEVRPDQASFFMVMPLPGSRNHQKMLQEGAPMESDYNRFDSFHESMPVCSRNPMML